MTVSIIIPIYNVEKYVLECLQSVANQTMTEGVECIIVDDCGSDNSMKVVEGFVNDYNGHILFQILHHKHNQGLSVARNTGIKQAKGEYLLFLDSDDAITNDCIQQMWELKEKHPMVDIVQGSFYENEEEKNTPSPFCFPEKSDDRKQIMRFLLTYDGTMIMAQNRLIRKEFLFSKGLFFEEGIIHEDIYWAYFVAKNVEHLCFNKRRTYYHRYNPNSITGKVNVAKEIKAFRTIIRGHCLSVDSFCKGLQREYILNNLLMAWRNNYFESTEDRSQTLASFRKISNPIQYFFLHRYLNMKDGVLKDRLLQIVIRLYKYM